MPWPESYGDPAAEHLVLETGIGLAEPGPFDKLVVRGPGALTSIRSLGLLANPGTASPLQAAGMTVWALADDEAIVILPGWTPEGAPEPGRAMELATGLRAAGATVTDVSSGLTVLALIGLQVRSLLEELCGIDLAPLALPDLGIAQLTMANCRVILARHDLGQLPGFTLLVGRDDAEHLWSVLVELGRPHGLAPVGMAVIEPAAAASPAPVVS
jgi:heterotetrameric sarcosine oxidase gamma subunit